MSTDAIAELTTDYLLTWTEPDAEVRRANIERMWAADGRMIVSSVGTLMEGPDEIAAHVTRVHDDLIAGKGLTFVYDQHVPAGDALLLRWSMRAPSGETVGRGVDVVFQNPDGRLATVYMFTGVS